MAVLSHAFCSDQRGLLAEQVAKLREISRGIALFLRILFRVAESFLDTFRCFKGICDAIAHRNAAIEIAAKIYARVLFLKIRACCSHVLIAYTILWYGPFPTLEVEKFGLTLYVQQFFKLRRDQ